MNQGTSSQIQEQANALRQGLKEWEKSFAATNQGRRAGREDIKAHPTIASKYKTYTKLRDLLAGKTPPTDHSSSPHPHQHPQPQSQSPPQFSRKRKHSSTSTTTHPPADAAPPHQTPRKLPRPFISTPLKPHHPSQLDPYDSPSSIRKLTLTPRVLRTSIGPTPQRDGRVLGLFDAFPDASPVKVRTTLASIPANAGAAPNGSGRGKGSVDGNGPLTTPSKQRSELVDARADTPTSGPARRPSRTPTSAGRRFLLDHYATPTARRTLPGADTNNNNNHNNDNSASSLRFATPAFLRRDRRPLNPAADTGDGEMSPGLGSGRGKGVRMPLDLRAPVRGGLSSLLAGLRRLEDERLDGEMEELRAVEEEEGDEGEKGTLTDVADHDHKRKNSGLSGSKDGVVVRDCQVAVAEKEKEKEEEKEMALGVDRGSSGDDSDYHSDSHADAQAHAANARRYKKKGQKRTTRRVVMRPQPLRPPPPPLDPSSATADGGAEAVPVEPVVGGGGSTGDGGKKAGRKISATAHANFRTLKLRGKGPKSRGKGMGNGRRFGGRR